MTNQKARVTKRAAILIASCVRMYILAVLFPSGSVDWRQPGLYLYDLGMTHERVCDASFEETREGDYS